MDGLLNTLKFVHKMSAGVIKFVVAVHNWFVRRGGCSIIDFYNVSCQRISSLWSGGHQSTNFTSSWYLKAFLYYYKTLFQF